MSGDIADNILKLQAELKVGFMGFEEKYISNVECRPHEMVQVSYSVCFDPNIRRRALHAGRGFT